MVVIIVGVLAAVAIPVFVSQRAKAHDTSTKADVTNIGKEISTYFVEGSGTLALDFVAAPGHVVLSDGSYSVTVNLTNGTASPTSNASANLGDDKAWCVSLTDPKGSIKNYRYSAAQDLEAGTC